jgi:hypothetical protein
MHGLGTFCERVPHRTVIFVNAGERCGHAGHLHDFVPPPQSSRRPATDKREIVGADLIARLPPRGQILTHRYLRPRLASVSRGFSLPGPPVHRTISDRQNFDVIILCAAATLKCVAM